MVRGGVGLLLLVVVVCVSAANNRENDSNGAIVCCVLVVEPVMTMVVVSCCLLLVFGAVSTSTLASFCFAGLRSYSGNHSIQVTRSCFAVLERPEPTTRLPARDES